MAHAEEDKKNALARWEVISKFAIPLAVAFVGAIFAWLQEIDSRRSTESRYFTDLMAQREKADSDLRQHMFDVLIKNYFGNPVGAASQQASGDPDGEDETGLSPDIRNVDRQLDRIHRQIIFASLLSRNFDNIDTRPLFEELDRKLSKLIWPTGEADATGLKADDPQTPQRQRAFTLREDLRRLAIGVSSRQVSALSSLKREGNDQRGRKQVFTARLCEDEPSVTLDGRFLLTSWKDGAVAMKALPSLTPSSSPAGPATTSDDMQLRVTFYDMPLLENLRFSDGTRGAFTLRSYISYAACSTFREQMDESLRAECSSLLSEYKRNKRICDYAIIVLTEIPDWYIAPRDRPYVTDLLAGRFSNGASR